MANSFHMDASALAKRYVPERGFSLINAILDTVSPDRIPVLNIGMGEVVSILVRKRNAGLISAAELAQALADFTAEIVRGAGIPKASVTSRIMTASFSLILAHSINSTDAIILKSALALAHKLRPGGDDLVLLTAAKPMHHRFAMHL